MGRPRSPRSPGSPMSDIASSTSPAPAPAPVAAAPKPVAAPAKPPAKKGDDRRGFLMYFFGSWAAFAWTSFVGTMALWTLGTLRFLFLNVTNEPPNLVKVGFPEGYEEGKVVERYKDQNIWVVR